MDKKLNPHKFFIPDNMFYCHLWVLVNYTPDELQKYLKKKYNINHPDDFSEAEFLAFTNKTTGDNLRFIWIKNFDWTTYQLVDLNHEILHYVLDVFRTRKIPVNDDTEEALTYYQEYISTKIYLKLKKKYTDQKRVNKKIK